jgi:hypothetical protein
VITLYYVYDGEKQVAGPYMAQAPATSYARLVTRWNRGDTPKTLEVIEETFASVCVATVRTVTDGKIHKCS